MSAILRASLVKKRKKLEDFVFARQIKLNLFFAYILTQSFPVHPFSDPWKRISRGYRKGALGTNGLKFKFQKNYSFSEQILWYSTTRRKEYKEEEISKNMQKYALSNFFSVSSCSRQVSIAVKRCCIWRDY